MNVGAYTSSSGGGDFPPKLDLKLFNKLKDKSGRVSGKILAVRNINSPKFQGLAFDCKNGSEKFVFLAGFKSKNGTPTGYDVAAAARQCGSDETDDWIGMTIKFIAKKGDSGTFINIENPKRK